MTTSVFSGIHLRKGQSCLLAIARELTQSLYSPRGEDPQVRTTFENRTAQNRPAPTMEQTIASHSMHGAVSGIRLPNDLRIGTGSCVHTFFVKKDWDNCGAVGREFLIKVYCSICVTGRSGACRARKISSASS